MEVPLEMQNRYIERRKQDLDHCWANLWNQNFAELEKVGHQLKGNGLTFGYQDLSLIGSHLELAAIQKNMDELERAVEDFSSWLNRQLN